MEIFRGGGTLTKGYVYFNLYYSADGSGTKRQKLVNNSATFTGLGGGNGYALPVAMTLINTTDYSVVTISATASIIFNVLGVKSDGSISYIPCINDSSYNLDVSDYEIIAFAHANNSGLYSMTVSVN